MIILEIDPPYLVTLDSNCVRCQVLRHLVSGVKVLRRQALG